MIDGCEYGGADMVWRDTVDSIKGNVARGKMSQPMLSALTQFLAIEIDETVTPARVRVARLPRSVVINMPAGLLFGGVRKALQRGADELNAIMSVYEYGTDEDVAAFICARGAAVRWDALRGRALAQDEWQSGLGFRLMLLKARSMGGYSK